MESPRWLLNQDPDSLEARRVIKKMRGFRNEFEVEHEVQHYLFAAAKHKTQRASAHSYEAMGDLIYNPEMRVLVVSSIVLQMSQQLCGINAVFYYSTSFFHGIIDDPLVGTNWVAFINVVATYIALRLMDSTARRTLLLWSTGGMMVSTVFILLAVSGLLPDYIALGAVMAFVSFFEIGLGPIPWLIVAEMFDSKYVATAMSISCIVNWGCNFLVGLLFPFMQEYLGALSFVPFLLVIICSFLFTWLYLPETYGRSVDEIQRLVQDPYDEVRSITQFSVW
jgi:SP family facilitated glucose transporter-like MFS transporter 3